MNSYIDNSEIHNAINSLAAALLKPQTETFEFLLMSDENESLGLTIWLNEDEGRLIKRIPLTELFDFVFDGEDEFVKTACDCLQKLYNYYIESN